MRFGTKHKEKTKRKISVTLKKRGEEPGFKLKLSVAQRSRFSNLEEREKHSICQRKRFENPAERKKLSDAAKRRFRNPEQRRLRSEGAKRQWEDLEQRRKMSNIVKELFKDPKRREFNSKMRKGKKLSEETKRKISVSSKAAWSEDLGRKIKASERFSGSKHPCWKGGISIEPYCEIWSDKEYKTSIKKRDNYRCQNPDCWHNCKKRLCIHHINYDKKDCRPINLITLCNSCNARANVNRMYWTGLYQNIMKGNKVCDVS